MWQAAFGLEHHANGVSLEAGTLFVSADRRSPLLALVAARTACGSEYVRRAMGIFVYVYVCSYFIVVWTYVRINMKQWLLSKRGFYVCVRFGHIVFILFFSCWILCCLLGFGFCCDSLSIPYMYLDTYVRYLFIFV